jgi:hypothetical protein
MQIRSVVVVAALGCSGFAHGQQAVQWRTQDGGNGHWYMAVQDVVRWETARVAAIARGGHLATVTSAAENGFAWGLTAGTNSWLGGYQADGACEPGCGWTWVTGESWDYSSWYWAEPNNLGGAEEWLQFWAGTSAWNDHTATVSFSYVVEWSADCDGNGIVDYGEILDGTLADTNANGVPDCCDAGVSCDPCPGDLNASNTVDAEDLAYILFAWGTDGGKTPEADIDGSGTVDANDLSVVLGSWGPCPN